MTIVKEIDGVELGDGIHLILGNDRVRLYNAFWSLAAFFDIDDDWERLCDEFGNDLHYTNIKKLMTDMREQGGQWFLSTMNPSVIDNTYYINANDVRSHIFFANEHSKLKAMTEEEAEDFFASYNVGFQHVSELLICKGLW